MVNKKLMPVLAIALLVVVGAVAAFGARGTGATTTPKVHVPSGAIVTSPNAGSGPSGRLPVIPDAPAPPPARGLVVNSDDFSSDTISKYQPLDAQNATWKVNNGRLLQLGGYDREVSDAPAVLYSKGVTFADNAIDAQIFAVAMPAGLVFRGSDSGYYRLTLFSNQPNASSKALLEKVQRDAVTTLAEVPASAFAGYTANQWTNVSVSAVGNHITASVNGTQILDTTDASFASGWAGVWATGDATAQFDNIRVQSAAK